MAITLAVMAPKIQRSTEDKIVQATPTTTDDFSPGQFVKLAAGLLVPSVSADASVFGMMEGSYPDPTGKLNESFVTVLRARGGQKIWMNVNGALSQANVGGQYGIVVTNGIAQVDLTNTTEKVFEIVEVGDMPGVLPLGGIGDTNARVLVEILSTAVA